MKKLGIIACVALVAFGLTMCQTESDWVTENKNNTTTNSGSGEEGNNNEAVEETEELLTVDYLNAGQELVMNTADGLKQALQTAVEGEGAAGAIEYCNHNAISLTEGNMPEGVIVRRTSVKYRNPNNAPTEQELKFLEAFSDKAGDIPLNTSHIFMDANGDHHFVKPIMMEALCLNCHGTPNVNIQSATMAKLKELYPDDLATGYKEGQLRGMWHVHFTGDFEGMPAD